MKAIFLGTRAPTYGFAVVRFQSLLRLRLRLCGRSLYAEKEKAVNLTSSSSVRSTRVTGFRSGLSGRSGSLASLLRRFFSLLFSRVVSSEFLVFIHGRWLSSVAAATGERSLLRSSGGRGQGAILGA